METLFKMLSPSFILFLVLLLVAFVQKTRGDAMVSGTVFCDQCKDGHRSLFDYPLSGMKVRVTCDSMEKEETTNWLGSYTVSFEGSPDLSGCYAHLLEDGQGSTKCGAVAGPAQQLKLMFKIFGMEMYAVDSLLSQPARPMSICPAVHPPPSPVGAAPRPPSPVGAVPSPRLPSPVKPPSSPVGVVPRPPSPVGALPTPVMPPSPPRAIPPIHFFQASACSHEIWTRPEYRCHWTFVQPDTKVAVAFGLIAARKYGNDMSLWQGIQGRGNIYRTLLREGTTALLNSYNSIQFHYPTLSVLYHMNSALMGTPRQALMTALRFKRANSGYGNSGARCNLTPCKR
ncbi:hypothetical protein AQUCO_00700920v1 [Aquilegia coerulea]|uniref:Uncharacterized protein n=1 Tax=Aquilegia coerulea TaxID=218851 RepID=A0A2G5EM91_AQUCA|nr:hypothetical protein AQUCO_00700920v1 [Aquilegia coerulea]